MQNDVFGAQLSVAFRGKDEIELTAGRGQPQQILLTLAAHHAVVLARGLDHHVDGIGANALDHHTHFLGHELLSAARHLGQRKARAEPGGHGGAAMDGTDKEGHGLEVERPKAGKVGGMEVEMAYAVARDVEIARNGGVDVELLGQIVGLGKESCGKGNVERGHALRHGKLHDLVDTGIETLKRCR